jgi:hypothetical protein
MFDPPAQRLQIRQGKAVGVKEFRIEVDILERL